MWTRLELKTKAKAALKANYFNTLLIALLLTILMGGGIGLTSYNSASGARSTISEFSQGEAANEITADTNAEEEAEQMLADIKERWNELKSQYPEEEWNKIAAIAIGAIAGAIMLIVIISELIAILLLNPLVVGCQNFFVQNSDHPAALGEVKRAFSPHWLHNVGTMFLRDLFLFLWGLLFIVPAIVKTYSYRLTPYILADNPEMSGTEAITLSRKMMNGHKWRTFVLDLSFIGWYLLAGLTFWILAIFYVNPYKYCTDAELYIRLKEE